MDVCGECYESKDYEEQTLRKAYMTEGDWEEVVEGKTSNIDENSECLVPAQLVRDTLDIIKCLNIILPSLREENNYLENHIRKMVLSDYEEY